MRLPQLKKRKWNYLLLSYLLPMTFYVILMAVSGYTPFGDKSLLYSDKWHQYYPFFKHFRSVLRNGGSLLYNWDIGMGLDYLGLISYYLASPLNLFSVLLPETWVLPYFELLTAFKLGFAGLFFAIFLKKLFGRDDLSIVLFGGFYAMCSWALGYQWNIMWLDSFALLPLVALGTITLLRDKKFVLYTVSLFLAVISNYYIGFFVCIFVLLVFICYQICRCKSLKRLALDFVRIGFFTVLAIGMTAILTLPALAALQTTHSSVNSYPDSFRLNIVAFDSYKEARTAWEAYKTAKEAGATGLFGLWWAAMSASMGPIFNGMGQIAANMNGGLEPTFKEGLPNVYCGVGTIIFAILFLTSGQVKFRDKLCSVFLLVFFMLSFLLRQLDYIWHGFHFPNMIPYRFSFLYSFVMLYMAYRAFTMWRRFQMWQIVVAWILALCVFLIGPDMKNPTFIAYNIVFLLLYLFVFVYARLDMKKPKEKAAIREFCAERKQRRHYASIGLAVVMVVELIANTANFATSFPYTSLPDYPKGTTYSASMIRYMKEDDSPFYRAEATHTQTLNDGALNGYSGITTFTSSANVKVTNFMQAMGFAAKNNYNRYCFEESSPVANLFLNLKYMLERDGKIEENNYFEKVHSYGKVALLENKAYLPLGFLANNQLGSVSFEHTGNNFYFQNQLFRAATGVTEDVWTQLSNSALKVVPNGTNVTQNGPAGITSYKNSSKSTTLTYTYTVNATGFMCLDMNMTARNAFAVWINGKQLYSESISLPQMFSVCQVKPGDKVEIKITCKANEEGKVTIRAGILNDAVFQKGYQTLAASTMQITNFKDTKVEGTINCDRDGLLYTSIPQNGNWTVTVDGKEADVVLVGDAMIGVKLTKGTHELRFVYKNKAFTMGLLIGLACFAVFMTIVGIVYYPQYQPKLIKLKAWIEEKKNPQAKKSAGKNQKKNKK